MLSLAAIALVVSSAGTGAFLFAQESVKPTQEEEDIYFSGMVEELASDTLVVSREILGNPPERRTFVINTETKTEGKLAEGARVTVKFRIDGDSRIAELIIVREQIPKKKKH